MKGNAEKPQENNPDEQEQQILALLDTVENLNGLIDRLDREINVLCIMRDQTLAALDAITAAPAPQKKGDQPISYPS